MALGKAQAGIAHFRQYSQDVGSTREIPYGRVVDHRTSWSAFARVVRRTQIHVQTYLDFMWVPPVLLEHTFHCHVARENHHFVVTLSAWQLTLLTCPWVWETETSSEWNCARTIAPKNERNVSTSFHAIFKQLTYCEVFKTRGCASLDLSSFINIGKGMSKVNVGIWTVNNINGMRKWSFYNEKWMHYCRINWSKFAHADLCRALACTSTVGCNGGFEVKNNGLCCGGIGGMTPSSFHPSDSGSHWTLHPENNTYIDKQSYTHTHRHTHTHAHTVVNKHCRTKDIEMVSRCIWRNIIQILYPSNPQHLRGRTD